MTWVHVLASGQVADPAFYATETAIDAVLGAGDSKIELTVIPDIVEPGVWYDATAQTFGLVPILSDTQRLRNAARNVHGQLLLWAEALTEEGLTWPFNVVNVGHNFLSYAHHGVYLMMHNYRYMVGQPQGRSPWTVDQRVNAANAMAMGAADVTSPHEFYEQMTLGESVLNAPTGPVLWVNVNTGERVSLTLVNTNTIDMELDEDQLPSESILHGNWIDSLEA